MGNQGHRHGRAQAFLLLLDTDKGTLEIMPFTDEERARSSEQYLATEKDIENKPWAQAVLVSVQSIRSLPMAFPNFYADTRLFIDAVRRAVS